MFTTKKELQTQIIKMNFKILTILFISVLTLTAKGQNFPDRNYLKGIAMMELGKYDSALIAFTISKGLYEKESKTWYYSGKANYSLGRTQEAIKDFIQAEKIRKGSAAYELAKAWARLNRVDKSLEFLEIHLNSYDKTPESVIMLDPDFQNFENNRVWIDFWKDSNHYSPFDKLLAEANYLLKSGDFLETIDLVNDGLNRGYRDAPLLQLRAKTYLEMNEPGPALKDLNRAIDRDKRNPELYFLRARVNIKLENFKEAGFDLEMVEKYKPEEIDLYLMRALAYGETQEFEKAEEDIRKYISLYPESAEAWYSFGKIKMLQEKFLDALRYLNKSLSLDRKKWEYYYARGYCYFNTRTYNYALRDFSMAMDLDPVNPEIYFMKGQTAVEMGRTDEACFNFRKALQYGKKEAFNLANQYCK